MSNTHFLVSGLSGFVGKGVARFLDDNNCSYQGVKTRRDQPGYENLPTSLDPSKEHVFVHLAGVSAVGDCQKDPQMAVDYNISLLIQTLDYCVANGVKKIIFSSSAFVYGDSHKTVHNEESALDLSNVYLTSKYMGEQIIRNYTKQHDIKGVVLRMSNIFGQASTDNTAFGSVFEQAKARSPKIEVYNTTSQRDFVYLKDVVSGIYACSVKDATEPFQIYNLASGNAISVGNLIAAFVGRIEGYSPEVIEQYPLTRDSILSVSIDKIKKEIGWEPQFTLAGALDQILVNDGE